MVTGTIRPAELPAEAARVGEPPISTLRYDWTFAGLAALLISGLYLDGWAHAHGKVDQSFFTAWHAVLYGAFGLLALWTLGTLARNVRRGYAWRSALPRGYGWSGLGVAVFTLGGPADLVWHTLFGIEETVDALLSPSHLLLALGGLLIVAGPLRAAWQRPVRSAQLWPAVLSATVVLGILGFFTNFASPMVSPQANRPPVPESLDSEIYRMASDGSAQTRLLGAPDAIAFTPSWSPDATRLVFNREVDDNADIYLVGADGRGLTRLTSDPARDWLPSWSPDGTRIAFTSDRDGNDEIYVMAADGRGVTRLTDNLAADGRPTWSPDSQRLVFVSDRSGQLGLWTMTADGRNPALVVAAGQPRYPAWSPDGQWIAYTANQGDLPRVMLIHPDGSGAKALTSDVASWAATWSPDGQRLALARDSSAGDGDIFTMRPDGSGLQNISNNPGQEDGVGWISWSAAGIAYAARGHLPYSPYMAQALGAASYLLHTALLMGVVLLLLRRWTLPFGSLALLFTVHSVWLSVLNDNYALVPAFIVGGLVADGLLRWLRPGPERPAALRCFSAAVPTVTYALFFALLAATDGLSWSVHLWAGAIALTAVVGLFLSYLAVPPLVGAAAHG